MSDKENLPSSLSLLAKFLQNNVIFNSNFWKYISIYTATFYSSWYILDKYYFPSIHKSAISICTKHAIATGSSNSNDDFEAISKIKHNKTIHELADNSSRVVSFTHALLGCAASVYFWKKYNHSLSDLIHPASISYRPDELSSLDLTSGFHHLLSFQFYL